MKFYQKALIVLFALCLLLAFAPAALATEDFVAEGKMGCLTGRSAPTAADAALLLRSLVRLETLTETQKVLGDVDHNGVITASDAARILRFLVRLESKVELVFAKTLGDYRFTAEDNKARIDAYLGTGLRAVKIPVSLEGHPVTALGKDSYLGCDLDSVTFPADPPEGLMDAGIAPGTVLYYALAHKSAWLGKGFDPTYHLVCIEEREISFAVDVPKDAVFSGAAQPITVTPSMAGISYTVSYNGSAGEPVNAGTYAYEITLTQPGYVAVGDNLVGSYTIAKADYDMSDVSFESKTINLTYDPGPHKLEIAGDLPDGVTASYVLTLTDAPFDETDVLGTHLLTARFTGDADNYNPIPDKIAALILIQDGMYQTVFDVTLPAGAVYDGTTVYEIVADPDPETDFEILYLKGGQLVTNPMTAGTYTYVIVILDPLFWAEDVTGSFEIAKATYDMSGISFSGDEYNLTTDPDTYKLEIGGTLPTGVSVEYYVNDAVFAGANTRGKYEVTARFTVADPDNYNTPADMTATLTLKETVTFAAPSGAVYNGTAQGLTASLPDGYTIAYTKGGAAAQPLNAGDYDYEITLTDNCLVTSSPLSGSFSIAKATVTGITFVDKTVTDFSGTQRLEIAGTLPTGVTVLYYEGGSVWSGSNVRGKYDLTAVFTDSTGNYNDIAPMTATLTLKQTITFTAPVGAEYRHGVAQGLAVSPAGSGYSITYNGSATVPTNVGTYNYVVTLTDPYLVAGSSLTGSYTIAKATLRLYLWNEEINLTGNPGPHFPVFFGDLTLPGDVSVAYVYVSGPDAAAQPSVPGASNEGTHRFTTTITFNADNYTLTGNLTASGTTGTVTAFRTTELKLERWTTGHV